jgi:hypothetical protein
VASGSGFVVPLAGIAAHDDLCFNSKRWSQKHADLVAAIGAVDHFKVGDVLWPATRKLKKKSSETYRYVEIEISMRISAPTSRLTTSDGRCLIVASSSLPPVTFSLRTSGQAQANG